MDTKVRTQMKLMMDFFETDQVHIVGGSLSPHETKDFDIAVGVDRKFHSPETIRQMSDLYNMKVYSRITCHQAYGDEVENPYHTIVVTTYQGVKMDFLFYFKDRHNVMSILDEFPLSIQMQAMSFDENLIVGKRYQTDPVMIFIPGKSEKKYRKYYPDMEFEYDITDLKSR